MFQLKLDDIEPVLKPEYYRKNIIAIIGDPGMRQTEGLRAKCRLAGKSASATPQATGR
jgi:hypothetical protein